VVGLALGGGRLFAGFTFALSGEALKDEGCHVWGDLIGDLPEDDLLDDPVLGAEPGDEPADEFFLSHAVPRTDAFELLFAAVSELDIKVLALFTLQPGWSALFGFVSCNVLAAHGSS
jgi:hypothetical protein